MCHETPKLISKVNMYINTPIFGYYKTTKQNIWRQHVMGEFTYMSARSSYY